MPLIKRTGEMVPGGYPYVDPRTNMRFAGMEGSFDDVVRRIIVHRVANPKIYPTSEPKYLSFDYVALELENYTCQRFGNDTRYCLGEDGQIVHHPKAVPPNGKCSCGGNLVDRYCPTCSGQKKIGTKCSVCGKEYS